jgi:hypothetical protein
MLNVKLRELLAIWKDNPSTTQSELINRFKWSPQNTDRYMKSIGLGKTRSADKEWRYVPLHGVEIQEITETSEDGLNERQWAEHYIELGYNSYSIALHQNILLSTVEKYRKDLKTHQEKQLLIKRKEDAQAREDQVFEDGQNKNNYPEFGDKPPQHVDDILQAIFFPNGIPTCFPCKRDVMYGKLVAKWNDGRDKYGTHANLVKMAKIEGKESYTSVPCYPKVILPMEVPEYFFQAFREFFNCPKTGYEEIDRQRDLEQFLHWILDYLFEWRLNWLLRRLLERRRERAGKAAEKYSAKGSGVQTSFSYEPPITEYDSDGNPIG